MGKTPMKLNIMTLCLVCTSLLQTANAQTNFQSPEGLIIAKTTGHLWVADYDADMVLELQGPFTSSKPAQAVTKITQGLSGPTRIAFDSNDNLYVTSSKGNHVTVYPKNSNGCYADSQADTLTGAGSSGGHEIQRPLGIAIDQSHNDVYIANNVGTQPWLFVYQNFTPRTNSSQNEPAPAGGVPLQNPAPGALAFLSGSGGNQLIVANGPTSGPSTLDVYNSFEGNPSLGYEPGVGSGIISPSTINTGPTGIAVDANSSIVAASYYYSGTILIKLTNTTMSTKAYSSAGVQGVSIGGCEGVAADLNIPGLLYVANASLHTIGVYNLAQSVPGTNLPAAVATITQWKCGTTSCSCP
jgi:hypothetical protein